MGGRAAWGFGPRGLALVSACGAVAPQVWRGRDAAEAFASFSLATCWLLDRKVAAGKLSNQRRTRIVLEVRETNLAAQVFFRSMGFRAVSVLRDFYDDTTEDAYLMQYRYRPLESEVTLPINRITKLAG